MRSARHKSSTLRPVFLFCLTGPYKNNTLNHLLPLCLRWVDLIRKALSVGFLLQCVFPVHAWLLVVQYAVF